MQDSKKKKDLVVDDLKPAEIKNGQLILTDKHKKLIKEQIAPDATPEELQLFLMMAHRTRLDPLLQQLYFIKYGQGSRARVSYVTSIDGYRIIAHRTKQFAGIDEPKYQMNNSGQLESCTITVYRKDSERGFSATVYFKEYNTNMNLWAKMPMTMIAKVAEAHALRKAFPQDLSGVYTTDEMDQASNPSPAPSPAKLQSQNTQGAPARTSRPMVGKVSPAQVKYIHSLLSQKNKSVDLIYKTLKITSLNDLNKDQASKIIDKLMKAEPDQKAAPSEPTEDAEYIDPDEVEAGMAKLEAEEAKQVNLYGEIDESPRAMPGEIKLFEIIVRRRAKQAKKSYEVMLESLLKKLKVESLNDLSQDQIKSMTDQVMEMNKDFEKKYDEEAKDIADTLGGTVEN